jgi:1-aminocyclopropane-1-carboxylate deaminase/D-cysteine desulfhydrase-like pyridoxal-dependent ACC family enzyme
MGMTQDFSIPETARPGVALFVDGENLSHTHATRVVAEAERLGARGVRRVYGDAQKVAKWRDQGTFRIVDCGPGKNAADILLALEALEAALVDGARHVVIASSDGDFAPLALKLAERGVRVTGIGEGKTPEAFRKACARFIPLDADKLAEAPPSAASFDQDKVVAWLKTELGQAAGKTMSLQALGSRMAQKYGITKAMLPVADWATFLRQIDGLVMAGKDGPRRAVRLVKAKTSNAGGCPELTEPSG